MEKKYIEMLSVYCYSEKAPLCIRFDIDPASGEWSMEDIDPNCIDEGCTDCY